MKFICEFIEELQFNIQIPSLQSISEVHSSMKEQCFHTKSIKKLFKIYDFHKGYKIVAWLETLGI